MAVRNLLAIKKLPAFKAWLDANGIENRPTGAAYQVIQVRVVGDPRWHPIFKRLDAKEHLSVPRPLVYLVERFLRKEAATGEAPPAIKPVAEEAANTLPWE